jgi:aerobic-type carbon monoxide dehydrogenase small subunit (CoxS/CutS family)
MRQQHKPRSGGRSSTGRRRPGRAPAGRPAACPAKVTLGLHVNGETQEVAFAPHKTLLEVLREDLGLTGTKHGCELGECGTCTVLLDGKPQLSCLVLGLECAGRPIVTVEGLADGRGPHPLQTAFADLGAAQCGYCTPGILCAARALLDEKPSPSRQEIREALSGNLCRCTGYIKIFEAVELAARRLKDPAARAERESLYGRRT